ncbi:ABC transporter substrate-binding protein [Opitutus terrae]|uniref:Extracellular ligand-binding receptor n=1 Tax=Opitutus terrae (strain DSM 11246 / JCM 15787 / PB90-1) TaxID=452637 RepID=B1ZYR6_OPITP|nr:ABC transporter substrate-binding protein [Opitutus terrae]ACB75302.1 Extracellular ligand-binding receptor [Opitutus terrae PB90-1]
MKLPRLLLVSAFTFCSLSAWAAEPIKVGEYASLTGKEASFGQSSHKGIVLAIEEINAAGGVLDRPLELISEDNQTRPGESATVVKKLIARDKVIALLGEVASGRALEAAPLAQAYRIPMIAPAATNPKVTQTGSYVFRVCFIDPFQGTVMAKFAHEDLKARKVAILSSVSNAYSVGLAKFFRDTFTAAGGEVAIEQKYQEGDKDFRAQLTAIKAANVDVVFVPGYYTEAALIVRQARELGLQIPFIGGDGWVADQLLEIGGDALNGCYYSTHFSPENQDPKVQAFVQRFRQRWGAENPDAFAALGYDAAYVLVDALRRAGSTAGPKLRDALAATKNFAGITGVTTIDQNRDASKPAAIIAIRDGKLTFHKTVAP